MISLQKDPSRDFVVLNITDPHLSDMLPDSPDLHHLTDTVNRLVARTKPQLITVSGDIGFSDWKNYPEVRRCFAELMEAQNLPWAVVWGNHDNQGGPETVQETVRFFQNYPHFLYESGDPALGNGNYVISIEENGVPVEGIIMMDSHDRVSFTNDSGETETVWAKLYPEQMTWYAQQIHALQSRGCSNSIMILHIPIYAYRQAFSAAFRQDLDLRRFPRDTSCNAECWNEGFENSFGVRYEGECSHPIDDSVFPVIKALGSTKVIVCGHDHANNWCVDYQDVRLTYGLKTGRGAYFSDGLNGGTVLSIRSDGYVDIRHEFIDSEF